MSAAHLLGPRVWVRNASNCASKVQYSTDKEARAHAKKIGVGKAYRCPKCRLWHLSSGRLPEGVRDHT